MLREKDVAAKERHINWGLGGEFSKCSDMVLDMFERKLSTAKVFKLMENLRRFMGSENKTVCVNMSMKEVVEVFGVYSAN